MVCRQSRMRFESMRAKGRRRGDSRMKIMMWMRAAFPKRGKTASSEEKRCTAGDWMMDSARRSRCSII